MYVHSSVLSEGRVVDQGRSDDRVWHRPYRRGDRHLLLGTHLIRDLVIGRTPVGIANVLKGQQTYVTINLGNEPLGDNQRVSAIWPAPASRAVDRARGAGLPFLNGVNGVRSTSRQATKYG